MKRPLPVHAAEQSLGVKSNDKSIQSKEGIPAFPSDELNSTSEDDSSKGSRRTQTISLADRLDHGYLTIREVCDLVQCGRSQVYEDIRAGALPIEKHGSNTRIAGPVAKKYKPGQRRRLGKA